MNGDKLKKDELKMKIKFLNMQLKFTFAMRFVMLIGLVLISVTK